MLNPLTTEWDRLRQEAEIIKYGSGFKWVKVTCDDGFVCRCTKQYWNRYLEDQCRRNNWKIEFMY